MMKKETKKINILFAAFEAAPFVKTGGLGDVAGSLPGAVNSAGFEVRVILPKLSIIPEKYKAKAKSVCSFNVQLGWRNLYCGLEKLRLGGVVYYLIDNEYYFKRERVYGEFDDGERTAYFSKAVLESILHMDDFKPDIIHCNDWHTALIPVFLHEQYKQSGVLENVRTVFTIHNLKFQGQFADSVISDICGLCGTPAQEQLKKDGAANYMQAAVKYADAVTTVSPSYAEEICTPYFGEGLDGLFREIRYKLRGIINGIDTKAYNPETDSNIKANYSFAYLQKKAECKAALQQELGLEVNPDIPLFAVVSRLTEQKGMDLINSCLPCFETEKIQLAVLGTGDKEYEEALKYYSGRLPEKIAARLEFNEALSRRFYAGADAFLMPSRFEPCGLSQLIAMRYGCLPVVRETGGLKDTVEPYNKFTGSGNGFSFANYNAEELKNKILEAEDLFVHDRNKWHALIEHAMNKDYSWKNSAKEYRKLYKQLFEKTI